MVGFFVSAFHEMMRVWMMAGAGISSSNCAVGMGGILHVLKK